MFASMTIVTAGRSRASRAVAVNCASCANSCRRNVVACYGNHKPGIEERSSLSTTQGPFAFRKYLRECRRLRFGGAEVPEGATGELTNAELVKLLHDIKQVTSCD